MMRFSVTKDLILTDEYQPPGTAPNRYVLLLSGDKERFYQPHDSVGAYRARASRLVGAWAAGARGARTEEERMAAIRYLSGLPAGSAKLLWIYKKQLPPKPAKPAKAIDKPRKKA